MIWITVYKLHPFIKESIAAPFRFKKEVYYANIKIDISIED